MKETVKAILMSSVIMILAIVAIIGFTYGWFAFGTTYTTNQVSVGSLQYTLSGSFIAEDSVIVPGENLVATPFEITNESPITSQMRIKITYTRVTEVGGTPTPENGYVYKNDTDDHLSVTFSSTFTFTDGDATPDEFDDDYWYYGDSSTVIGIDSGLISVISDIHYDGAKTSVDYNGQDIVITVSIEVKQADAVTWSELVTYDFETGYPA